MPVIYPKTVHLPMRHNKHSQSTNLRDKKSLILKLTILQGLVIWKYCINPNHSITGAKAQCRLSIISHRDYPFLFQHLYTSTRGVSLLKKVLRLFKDVELTGKEQQKTSNFVHGIHNLSYVEWYKSYSSNFEIRDDILKNFGDLLTFFNL